MSEKENFDWTKLAFPISFLGLIWIIHIAQILFDFNLAFVFGLKPLSLPRISGILTAPLIHGDWGHLLNNTLSFAGLSFILFFFYRKIAFKSFVMLYVLTGIGVWLFGRNTFHIGASGVVYGLVGLLFWIGIFRHSIRSIAIALVVLVLYSGMFYGLLPKENISHESHIIGALSGIFTAYYFKDEIEEDEVIVTKTHDFEHKRFFLPRDVFEKTRQQRYLDQQNKGFPES